MNKTIFVFSAVLILESCSHNKAPERIPVAEVGKVILYYDMIPKLIQHGINETDSVAIIQNYINKWAKRELLLQKAEENLQASLKEEIDQELKDTRANLVIYQYQRQMMIEKMDTIISESELLNYYNTNKLSFTLTSNIVKALFIKLPAEAPDLNKVKLWARSNAQKDLQLLESYCYQFAEKFDDFNEEWVSMDRLSVELHKDIENEETFLRNTTFFESRDSTSIYLVYIRDYRLRSAIAPFEYVMDDIKRIIWNTRRFDFVQSLENGIYNDALKQNNFKIY
jgi:hypothetical protein